MSNVIPAILEYDRSELARKIQLALSFADHIHIDLIDSSFGQPNIIEPDFFKPYTSQAFFELHLMVSNPSQYIKSFAEAGFSSFIGQVEHMDDPQEFISHVLHVKKEPFLGIDSDTSIEEALNFNVGHSGLSGVMIMTVKAGASGRGFEDSSIEKIKHVKQHFPELVIEVDGHIDEETLHMCQDAGAQIFAANSFIFGSNNPAKQYKLLTTLSEEA